MAPTPKKVRYNIMMPLVCEEHHEHGPLLCCPFPGCRNGTDAEEIQAVAPAIDAKVYRRTVWTDAEGEISYSWRRASTPSPVQRRCATFWLRCPGFGPKA